MEQGDGAAGGGGGSRQEGVQVSYVWYGLENVWWSWLRGLIWLESAVEGNEGECEREMVRVGVRVWGIALSLPLSAVNGEVHSRAARGRSRGEWDGEQGAWRRRRRRRE
jgi:hypothetical protein